MVETEGLEKEKLKANLNRLKRKCSFFSFKCLGFEYVYKSLCEYDVDVEKKTLKSNPKKHHILMKASNLWAHFMSFLSEKLLDIAINICYFSHHAIEV